MNTDRPSNMRRLAIAKMARDAVPPGGGLASAVKFLSSPQEMITSARAAEEWAKAAVQAVRMSGDPNPYEHADDETIAGVILDQLANEPRKRR